MPISFNSVYSWWWIERSGTYSVVSIQCSCVEWSSVVWVQRSVYAGIMWLNGTTSGGFCKYANYKLNWIRNFEFLQYWNFYQIFKEDFFLTSQFASIKFYGFSRTNLCTVWCVCVCVCVCRYTTFFHSVHLYIYIYVCVCVCVCVCVRVYIYTRARANTHTHTHMYIYIYIYIMCVYVGVFPTHYIYTVKEKKCTKLGCLCCTL